MPVKGGSGGGGAGAKGVRAGAAFVELFGDDTKLARTLSATKAKLQHFGAFVGKIGLGMAGAGAGLLAPLTALLKGGADRADQIGDIADVFGLTADSASRMASAFEIAGGTIDDLQMSLVKLAESNTTGKPLDEHFMDVADSIGEMTDATERFKAAKEIFGAKFAAKFIDMSGDVKDFVGNAPGLSEAEIKNAKALNQELARTGIVFKSALLPALQIVGPLAKGFMQFAQANAGLLVPVAAVAAGLVALGGVLAVAGFGLSGLAAAAGTVVSALGLLLTPAGAVAAAIAGIGYLFVTQTEAGKRFGAELGDMFAALGQTFRDAWGGIVAALGSGDLELAGRIAAKGMEVVWLTMVDKLTQAWVGFKDKVIGGWHDVTDFLAEGASAWAASWTWLTDGLDAAKDQHQGTLDQLAAMRRETDAESRKARNDQLEAAKADLEKARADLAALVGRANAGAGKGLEKSPSLDRQQRRLLDLYGQVQGGTFTPAAGQQFAFGAKTTADAMKDIAKTGKAQLDTTKKISDQLDAFGLTFQ